MRWLARITNGKSDQVGCSLTQPIKAVSPVLKASSATTATPAPSCRALTNWGMSLHTAAWRPAAPICSAAAAPSRPVGARTRTRERLSGDCGIVRVSHQGIGLADVARRSREYASELLQRGPDLDTAVAQAKLPDGVLVSTTALFHDRQCAAHQSVRLEVAKHDYGVAQVTDVQRRLHRPHQAMLGEDQDGHHPKLVEVTQQLVHLKDKEFFIGHGVQIAVQAVDDHHARMLLFHRLAHDGGKFTRRHLGGVNLTNLEPSGIDVRAKLNA